ncbi:MAG TPA: hypothetical protein VJM11_02025 [Nevskiaceae bacterium]|nr:hypothetical protein [Nevskiaceae bacterium]
MSKDPDWFATQHEGFGRFTPEDDLLHPGHRKDGDSLTETQYFGFNIPAESIYCFGYFWLHPNLDVVSGGLFVCQGIKSAHLQAELFDIHAYVHRKSVIRDDLRSYRFPNGYGVDVLEPGRRMRIRYDDASRGNHVDVEATAIMPVAMRGNDKHFEQAMRMRGSLMLRGKKHVVDGFNIRDRSWGELRPEEPQALPPMTWLTGAFDDDFAFNCNAFDHPDLEPEWKGRLSLSPERAFNDGWVFHDGKLLRLRTARKRTVRDPRTGRPLSHRIETEDANGKSWTITGTVRAGLPWAGWPNMICQLFLTRWECEGRVGWGDTQEVQWTDYVRACTQPPTQ